MLARAERRKLGTGQFPKIYGPFEVQILLADTGRGDGDNRIKALLDWLQSRDIVRNDCDCRRGRLLAPSICLYRQQTAPQLRRGCRQRPLCAAVAQSFEEISDRHF